MIILKGKRKRREHTGQWALVFALTRGYQRRPSEANKLYLDKSVYSDCVVLNVVRGSDACVQAMEIIGNKLRSIRGTRPLIAIVAPIEMLGKFGYRLHKKFCHRKAMLAATKTLVVDGHEYFVNPEAFPDNEWEGY